MENETNSNKINFNSNNNNLPNNNINNLIQENKNKINSSTNDLNENSDLFSIITEELINNWKLILCDKNNNLQNEEEITDEKILETIKSTQRILFDEDDIIAKDISRTRIQNSDLLPEFSLYLEALITFYCTQNCIKYKQGLNEIIGVFILIKYKLKKITLVEIYKLINGFINLFLFNYYYEHTCFALKNSLSLLTLLIKYHIPSLYNILDQEKICPEMYGISWLITIFSPKLDIDLVYQLWNKLINDKDPLMVHYIIVSLLYHNKEKFIHADLGAVLVLLNQINMKSKEEIDKIYNYALELRLQTPYSFRLLADKLEIFNNGSFNHKDLYDIYKPSKLVSLPIFPSEIYYICYNNIIKCPNDIHNDMIINSKNNENEDNKNFCCEHCDMKIIKNINYILLDLRILEKGTFEKANEKSGFLPKMIMIKQKELKLDTLPEIIDKRFSEVKDKYHFIFMTSKTDSFEKFESDYYKNNSETNDNDLSLHNSLIRMHDEKEINKQKAKKLKHDEKKILKEYDSLKQLLLYLLDNNYPHISFIYGGFNEIHNEIVSKPKLGISLLNHNDNQCYLCKKNKKPKLKFDCNFINSLLLQRHQSRKFHLFHRVWKTVKRRSSFDMRISKAAKEEKTKIDLEEINNVEKKKSFIDIEKVNEMIIEHKDFLAYCKFILCPDNHEPENVYIEVNQSENKGIFIINNGKLLMIKGISSSKKNMEIIEEIELNEIVEVKRKEKFFAYIIYNENNCGQNIKQKMVIAKFKLEEDVKNLKNALLNDKK